VPELILGPVLRYVGIDAATVWVEADAPCQVEVLGHRLAGHRQFAGQFGRRWCGGGLAWHRRREDAVAMKIEGQGKLLRIFIGESDRWEGRPVIVVETTPSEWNDERERRGTHRFWIDPARNFVIVRRAALVNHGPEHEWMEFGRIESYEHEEVEPGIWLPKRVRSESFGVPITPDIEPRLMLRIEATNRDWRVNAEIPDSRFELEFPPGVRVTDRREENTDEED
jgi:hypothetical protein